MATESFLSYIVPLVTASGVKYVHSAGLATEFMSKAEIKKYYTKKGPSGYNDTVPDFHRSRYISDNEIHLQLH